MSMGNRVVENNVLKESQSENNKAKTSSLETFFVHSGKGISWLLLMVVGVSICCIPWLAASFGLVLPTIFAGFTFPAMLTLGLTIAIPSLMLTVASGLHIFNKPKRGLAKLIGNIALGVMALTALVIGILLLAAPGLPIISAFAGMIGGLGSFGALLTKISLIALGAYKVADVVMDFVNGSLRRVLYGAIGNGVTIELKPKFRDYIFIDFHKKIKNLAIIALGIIVCCKISLAVGLVFAIPSGLKLIANFLDKQGNKWAHKVAKFLDNSVRGTFGAALLYTGISFLQPAVLFGFLGKLSFIAAAFPGVVGLAVGTSLIAFGVLTLFNSVIDAICGDKEKMRQGVFEIATSMSERVRQIDLQSGLGFLDVNSKKEKLNDIAPYLELKEKFGDTNKEEDDLTE